MLVKTTQVKEQSLYWIKASLNNTPECPSLPEPLP